jgi:hypothetical protein
MTSAIQILTLQFADSSSKMLKILADRRTASGDLTARVNGFLTVSE